MFNVTGVVGGPFATSLYQCYLFMDDFEDYTKTRMSQFKDFIDIYTSFLFNLLSQSLQLKSYADNIAKYETQGNMYSYAETLAKIIRTVLDFESSEASSNIETQMPSIRAARQLKMHSPTEYHKDGFLSQIIAGVVNAIKPRINQQQPVSLKGF